MFQKQKLNKEISIREKTRHTIKGELIAYIVYVSLLNGIHKILISWHSIRLSTRFLTSKVTNVAIIPTEQKLGHKGRITAKDNSDNSRPSS